MDLNQPDTFLSRLSLGGLYSSSLMERGNIFPVPGPRFSRLADGAGALPPRPAHTPVTLPVCHCAPARRDGTRGCGGVAARACRHRPFARRGRGPAWRRVLPGPAAAWLRGAGRAERSARYPSRRGQLKKQTIRLCQLRARALPTMPRAPGAAAAAALGTGLGWRPGPPRPDPGCGVTPRSGKLRDSQSGQSRAGGGKLPARGRTPNYKPGPAGRKRRDAPQEAGYGDAAVALRRSRPGRP